MCGWCNIKNVCFYWKSCFPQFFQYYQVRRLLTWLKEYRRCWPVSISWVLVASFLLIRLVYSWSALRWKEKYIYTLLLCLSLLKCSWLHHIDGFDLCLIFLYFLIPKADLWIWRSADDAVPSAHGNNFIVHCFCHSTWLNAPFSSIKRSLPQNKLLSRASLFGQYFLLMLQVCWAAQFG